MIEVRRATDEISSSDLRKEFGLKDVTRKSMYFYERAYREVNVNYSNGHVVLAAHSLLCEHRHTWKK